MHAYNTYDGVPPKQDKANQKFISTTEEYFYFVIRNHPEEIIEKKPKYSGTSVDVQTDFVVNGTDEVIAYIDNHSNGKCFYIKDPQ